MLKDREDKNLFKMYDQNSGVFVLSARRDKSTFWISQYECIPKLAEKSAFTAVVRPYESSSAKVRKFRMFSTKCEHCDDELFKYTCGHNEEKKEGETGFEERQHLADIRHTDQIIRGADVQARFMDCEIPFVRSDLSRVVWCPRAAKEAEPEERYERLGSPHSKTDEVAFSFDTKLPEWNHAAESLVMQFAGRRVKVASSKNMLLHCKVGDEKPKQMLQFGKACSGKYHLDYKHPMSALQAFGICLTTFAWQKK